ncbi:MAG: anhydro-N-acetylmuramic acid kinase [Bacteroidetes bacterium]|nr:anhydro-N-acetylmuramic acid kinase [Bacteroidota bacterium]
MKNTFLGIGVMSGTSLDGLDLALCRFIFNDSWNYEILRATCIKYNSEWENRLLNASLLSGFKFTKLNIDFGRFIGEMINEFLKTTTEKIDFIASHGHTVFHSPQENISLQIGDGAAITAITGIDSVTNFRTLDVNLGGQGAPLVPIGDEFLFSEYNFCLNLGGIANFSFSKEGKRLAYDICPCNILLNKLAQSLGKPFDENGELAATGVANDAVLQQLNDWEYYKKSAPKSLDKEKLLQDLWQKIEVKEISIADKLNTVVMHISEQINNELNTAIKASGITKPRVLVTGGGVYNSFLIKSLKQNKNIEFVIPSKEIIEYKEALIFAFLGLLRLQDKVNTLKSVTGALVDSIGGAVYKACPTI